MITVQAVSNTKLNQRKQQHKPLTEHEKLHNRIEGCLKFAHIFLEEIKKYGGLNQ